MDPDELKDLMTDFGDGIEAFKKTQAARVDELEAKLNRAVTFGGMPARPAGGIGATETKALSTFIRTGSDTELKAMSIGSDPDGGYLVAPALSDSMIVKAWDVSPIGRLARRVQIGAGDAFEEPIDADESGASWVGENSARPATDTPELKSLRVPVHELYALQRVTQRLLDDARFDVGAWIGTKINDKFARTFGAAFVAGDGVAKPRGLLDYPTAATADATRPWGTIQHINSGDASSFRPRSGDTNPVDDLISMIYALRAPYRANARWTMNSTTAGTIRKMKDGQGNYIWAEAREGQPATMLGYPVETDEEMPDVAAGKYPVAFGDFRQAYVIVEKPGIRLLRDPYSSKPAVDFYAYGRVGGGVQNSEAVKLLRIAASG